MARYVDIEKAEYPYMSMSMFGINSKDCKAYNEGVKATEDMIQALPTADVVEVVRCEKCKHGDVSIIAKTKDGEETIVCFCNAKNRVTDLEYYCACGERRTDNE